MPVRLSTTLSKISSVPNSTNAELLDRLYSFMKSTGASESHCNNTLKTAIAFAHYIGSDQSFNDIRMKDKIVGFLDTKIKDSVSDPDKRWITTWNDYLGSGSLYLRQISIVLYILNPIYSTVHTTTTI